MFRSLVLAALVGGSALLGSAAPAEAGGVRFWAGPRGFAVRSYGPRYVARPIYVRPVYRPIVVRPRYVAPVYGAPVYAAPVYGAYRYGGVGYGYASPYAYGGWYGY